MSAPAATARLPRQDRRRILVYYPNNKPSASFEMMFAAYLEQGHEVHLLTMREPGELHRRALEAGVRADALPARGPRFTRYFEHVWNLVAYCRRHRIEFVLSQLQQANIVAMTAARFSKARFWLFRHHDRAYSRKEAICDFLINRFGGRMAVLSETAKRWVEAEGVPSRRLAIVPLMYAIPRTPDAEKVAAIRAAYPCALLVIMISRLVAVKRHRLAIEAMEALARESADVKLLVLDDGPERGELERQVRERRLERKIHFLGYRYDVAELLQASDVLLQPSLSEVSTNAVKEAGMSEKIVVACRGVGDFDEYLRDMQNAVLIDQNDDAARVAEVLRDILRHRSKYEALGPALRRSVADRFYRPERSIPPYLGLLEAR